MEIKTKVVIQPDLARNLLKKGYKIVDIKPRRKIPEATSFVFEIEEGLLEFIDSWKK